MNTVKNKDTLKTPSQDAQGRWYELLSPTQVLSAQEQQPNFNNNNQQQQQQQMKKKKKSHGNRKEQHKRRRLRRQQQKMNNNQNPTNQNSIHVRNQSIGQKQIQKDVQNNEHSYRSKNKRKHQDLHQNDTNVNRSLSQLSISQENNPKKKQMTVATAAAGTTITEANNLSTNEIIIVGTSDNQQEIENNEDEENHVQLPTKSSLQKFKPQYLKVSDQVFKQTLSNTVQDADKIVQYLNTDEKLRIVRQMTEITNDLHYFDLQRKLWQGYYNLGIKENIWPTLPTDSLPASNIEQTKKNKIYYFPKHLIEKRQQNIAYQYQRTYNEFQQYLINFQKAIEQWQPLIDSRLLAQIITECVQRNQQRLKQEFQYKIDIAELDLYDRRSISKFYDLQPNDEQIHLVKRYWQVIANKQRTTEQIEKLRKRIFLQRIPSKINKIIDHSIDHIEPMLMNSVLDKDSRAGIISNYSKKITQYKFDLMSLNLNTLENIRRGHQQLLIDLQEQISKICPSSLKQAIENRQQTMKNRHKKCLEHTLQTFFDEAPTTVSND